MANKYGVARYRIRLEKPQLHIAPTGLKIVYLTDLHNCEWGPDNQVLLDLVEAEKPDLVLCGGDMPLAHPGAAPDVAVHFLRELSERHRVYYGFGNHEYRLRIYPETYGDVYRQYLAALRGCDIVFLDNADTALTVKGIPVRIFGLSIGRKYYRRGTRERMPADYIEKLIGPPDPAAVNLLLAHTPRYLESCFAWGADLTLCGHYHGGVMRLPHGRSLLSPDPGLFPRNARGGFRHGRQAAVVSAGLGEHTVKLRVRNPREIVSIRLLIR